MMKRLLRTALAIVLACGLLPSVAFADEEFEGDAAPSTTTGMSYVDGEALVVYHDVAGAENGIAPFSHEAQSSALAEAGVTIEETWNLSAPDETTENGVAPLSLDESAQGGSEGAAGMLPSGVDMRVALVSGDGATTEELVERLNQLDCVEAAAPNYMRTIALDAEGNDEIVANEQLGDASKVVESQPSIPTASTTAPVNDTFFDYQYGVGDGVGGMHIAAALAADAAAGSAVEQNVVAVIDTGVDYTHPDLVDSMWTDDGTLGLPGGAGSHGYDFGDLDSDVMPGSSFASSHGTHCAGIIAAQTDNDLGIAAPAQHTEIMGIKISPSTAATGGFGDVALVAAYNYVIQAVAAGVNVVAINGSWDLGFYSPVLDYVINQAGKAGVVSFLAAGNEATDTITGAGAGTVDLESPYAVAVGASNDVNALWNQSNFNETQVDLAAPGANILSSMSTGAVNAAFNAHFSKISGVTLPYCANMGELVRDGKITTRIVYGSDPAELVDQSAVLLSPTTGPEGGDALEMMVDTTKLTHSVGEYQILLDWTIANPFLGSTLSASDYAVSIFPSVDRMKISPDAIIRVDSRLSSLDGQTSYASSRASIAVMVDNLQPNDTALDAIDTTAAELTAGCTVTILGDTSGDTLFLNLADYGIGVKSRDYAPYNMMSGTSMATPAAAGSYAELASLYPNESALELRGRLIGGTVPLATADDQAKIASGGRFSFDVALDDDAINATTWAVECDAATKKITVYGYALGDATLTVDGVPVTTSVTSDGSALVFTSDPALFDGNKHRFDVIDTSTGRTYRASYTVPMASSEPQNLLEKVMDLPEASSISGTGVIVAGNDRLFFADAYGEYLYACADPTAEGALWEKLAAPGLSYLTSQGDTSELRASLRFGYLNGTVYAFGCDMRADDTHTGLSVFCALYDIATDSWSTFEEVDHVRGSEGDAITIIDVSNPVAYEGSMNILLSYNIAGSDGSSGVAARLLAGTADSGFTATAFQAADLSSYQPIGLYADNQLHALVMSGEGATRTGAYVTYENGTWSAPRMLSGAPVLSENSARDFIKVVKTSTGTGLLATGHSFVDSGDTMLLNASTEEWTTLGTFGTSQSNGLVVSSATMLGGSVYVAALDASMTDDVAQAATATATQGALYAFPADVAARLGSLDRSVAASAQEGGTATVADWRGDAAAQATVRMQDSATWTAKPSKSYAFNGWYDINGVLVSSNETYHASVLNDTALTAHFVATDSGGGSAEEGGVSPSSTSPSTPATLVRTGDYTLPLVALLVMLAATAAIVLTASYRRKR